MEWVSLHCFWEGNACWTLTTAWTMARDPQFIILLSGVLYRFALKTVSSSMLVIPWCCAYFVLVKMPSCIWAHFILTFSLGAVSTLSTVKTNHTVPFPRIQSLPSSGLLKQTRCCRHFTRSYLPLSSPFHRFPVILSTLFMVSYLHSLKRYFLISKLWPMLHLVLIYLSATFSVCPDQTHPFQSKVNSPLLRDSYSRIGWPLLPVNFYCTC